MYLFPYLKPIVKKMNSNINDTIENINEDITKRNKMGQTPLMYFHYLEKEKSIKCDLFISVLQN